MDMVLARYGFVFDRCTVWGETTSSTVVDSPASPLTPPHPPCKGGVQEGSFVVDSSPSSLTPPTPLSKGGVQEETFMHGKANFHLLFPPYQGG
jgi:hypothetical protein